jgi:hypothetical protein
LAAITAMIPEDSSASAGTSERGFVAAARTATRTHGEKPS